MRLHGSGFWQIPGDEVPEKQSGPLTSSFGTEKIIVAIQIEPHESTTVVSGFSSQLNMKGKLCAAS